MQVFEKYLNQFPVIPDVASKILSIGEEDGDYSFRNLEEIISIDPMLTSRILKVANSALYARQKEINTLQMAIGLLGFKNIRSLVLLLTASQFSRKLGSAVFYDRFWKHSIVTAFVAREILARRKDRANQELAFTLGLLHDMGKVALYNADPAEYGKVMDMADRSSIPVEKIEREILKTDHLEIGALVLEHWNLPPVFSEAAGRHNSFNNFSPQRNLVDTVAAADMIATSMGYAMGGRPLEATDVEIKDREYFLEEYRTVLEEDPLFLECGKLFFSGEL